MTSQENSLQQAIDLYQAGRVPDAIKLLRPVVDENPESPTLTGYLACLYAYSEDFDNALHFGEISTLLSPRSELARRTLTGTYFNLRRFREAEESAKILHGITGSDEDWELYQSIKRIAQKRARKKN